MVCCDILPAFVLQALISNGFSRKNGDRAAQRGADV